LKEQFFEIRNIISSSWSSLRILL